MASPSPRGHEALHPRRYWNAYELQAVCALVCKGAHLKGSLSFATKLNKILNGRDGYKDDIDIQDVDELLEHIEKDKKAALAFIERQGYARITRTQRRVFERSLGFDGTMAEWEGGRKEKVMQGRQATTLDDDDGEAKGKEEHFMAANGTRIDRWTPSMRTEIAQADDARVSYRDQINDGPMAAKAGSTIKQPFDMQEDNLPLTRDIANSTPGYASYHPPTPVWGDPSTTQPTGRGYMPPSENLSSAWGAKGAATPQGWSSSPPWRSAQQQSTGGRSTPPSGFPYVEPGRYPHHHQQPWGPRYESPEGK